jgi:hypothetical protein
MNYCTRYMTAHRMAGMSLWDSNIVSTRFHRKAHCMMFEFIVLATVGALALAVFGPRYVARVKPPKGLDLDDPERRRFMEMSK